jgi:hypothetical protein
MVSLRSTYPAGYELLNDALLRIPGQSSGCIAHGRTLGLIPFAPPAWLKPCIFRANLLAIETHSVEFLGQASLRVPNHHIEGWNGFCHNGEPLCLSSHSFLRLPRRGTFHDGNAGRHFHQSRHTGG